MPHLSEGALNEMESNIPIIPRADQVDTDANNTSVVTISNDGIPIASITNEEIIPIAIASASPLNHDATTRQTITVNMKFALQVSFGIILSILAMALYRHIQDDAKLI